MPVLSMTATTTEIYILSLHDALPISVGHDTIEIRANDGTDWGAWKTFDLNTRLPDRAPVVTRSEVLTPEHQAHTEAVSPLLLVKEADADTMTQYHLYDAGVDGGHFTS